MPGATNVHVMAGEAMDTPILLVKFIKPGWDSAAHG